jgi:hypothetical protein
VYPAILRYDNAKLARLYEEMTDRINTLPGTVQTTRSSYPLVQSSSSYTNIYVPGNAVDAQTQSVRRLRGGGAFLETLGIPIVEGAGS